MKSSEMTASYLVHASKDYSSPDNTATPDGVQLQGSLQMESESADSSGASHSLIQVPKDIQAAVDANDGKLLLSSQCSSVPVKGRSLNLRPQLLAYHAAKELVVDDEDDASKGYFARPEPETNPASTAEKMGSFRPNRPRAKARQHEPEAIVTEAASYVKAHQQSAKVPSNDRCEDDGIKLRDHYRPENVPPTSSASRRAKLEDNNEPRAHYTNQPHTQNSDCGKDECKSYYSDDEVAYSRRERGPKSNPKSGNSSGFSDFWAKTIAQIVVQGFAQSRTESPRSDNAFLRKLKDPELVEYGSDPIAT